MPNTLDIIKSLHREIVPGDVLPKKIESSVIAADCLLAKSKYELQQSNKLPEIDGVLQGIDDTLQNLGKKNERLQTSLSTKIEDSHDAAVDKVEAVEAQRKEQDDRIDDLSEKRLEVILEMVQAIAEGKSIPPELPKQIQEIAKTTKDSVIPANEAIKKSQDAVIKEVKNVANEVASFARPHVSTASLEGKTSEGKISESQTTLRS